MKNSFPAFFVTQERKKICLRSSTGDIARYPIGRRQSHR